MRTLFAMLCACLCVACDEPAGTAEPAPEGRVNAVLSTKKAITFADLCDVTKSADAKPFTWPALVEPAPSSTTRYRWVNLWATWCKPCIEELPLLTETFKSWAKQGQDVTLTLMSVDADASAAKTFVTTHTGVPSTLQLSDPSQAGAWLTNLGLQSGSAIPVHIVLDAQGQLVCARGGGISEVDLERFRTAMFP
jgi:thiol-disulfide isomerase/thioredoxin